MPNQIPKRPSRFPVGATREKGERISEYFAPEKAQRFVRRFELLAMLTQHHKAMQQNRPLSKLWRWLRAPRGSGGVHAVEPPKKGGTE